MNTFTNIVSWFVKNLARITAIVDAVAKVFGIIASFTPWEWDDKVDEWLDTHKIEDYLKRAADFLERYAK